MGIAAKVGDGNLKALMVAVIAVLEQLGWLDEEARQALKDWLPAPLKNAAGHEVGHMMAVLRLA